MKSLEVLRALGTGDEAPAEAKQRVYGAVQASLAAAASVAALPKASSTLPPPTAPLLTRIASSKALLLGAGIWLMGGATGAALYGALQHERVRVVYVDRAVSATPEPAPSANALRETPAGAPASSAAIPSATVHAAASPSASASAANSGQSQLARERALLDLARERAAQGEPALVLEVVEKHRQQFPHGRLSEEREALGIRALLALGRRDEARARAAAFRASYPNSFLTPVIDSALSAP